MEDKEAPPLSKPSKKDNSKNQHQTNEVPDPGRRNFLKLLLPGVLIGTGVGIGILKNKTESGKSKDFKQRILDFDQIDSEQEVKAFVGELADKYLELTGSTVVTKESLIRDTSFYKDQQSYLEAIKKYDKNFAASDSNWGYTDFISRKCFINLASLKQQTLAEVPDPNKKVMGLALLDAAWHEWGHLDVKDRTVGELMNDPTKSYLTSPTTGQREGYVRYRGAQVYTKTYYGFDRFEEVLNETINIRRMIEQVGLEVVIGTKDYNTNGLDILPRFTSAQHIPLTTLYQMHQTSDFEGILKLLGDHLPGTEASIVKGKALAIGIHDSNAELIKRVGILDRLN